MKEDMNTFQYIPPLPPKMRHTSSTTLTQISNSQLSANEFINSDGPMDTLDSSMHSVVLNSKKSATVFIAAKPPDATDSPHPGNARNHVVTIRINTDSDAKVPKISSVHLKSDGFDTFKLNDIYKKNNSLVRISLDDRTSNDNEEVHRTPEKAPYIYCNPYGGNAISNMIMSSGQCSPSDTLDSGTCSDLDGTPPPLPKKKTTKSTATDKKAVTVTLISSINDYEDNDSNISCDSLNSSELNVHNDENHDDSNKKEKSQIHAPAQISAFDSADNKDSSFLPRGLLQDIRDRSAKLNAVETESDLKNDDSSHGSEQEVNLNINENVNQSKESTQLTSFRLVSQYAVADTTLDKTPLISESTYEDRKKDKMKQDRICYSSNYFDTDKYYEFHLNESQFEEKPVKSASESVKSDELDGAEYFAGVKDYKNEEPPSTIKSSKGTIRGVKNRVRAGIATFLQIQSTTKVILLNYY